MEASEVNTDFYQLLGGFGFRQGGVVEAERDQAGELWFAPDEVSALARIQRLRAGFALNYAAVGLVTDLLDRIAVRQARARRSGG